MRLGLRTKGIVLVAALTFFASFLPVLFFYVQVSAAVDGELQEKARVIAKGLAYNSRLYVVLADQAELDKLCQGVLASPDVLYVVVAGKAGDFISSHERKDASGKPDPEGTAALGALRRRELRPSASLTSAALESGHRYYEVLEPVERVQEATALDELDGSAGGGATAEAIGLVCVGVSRAAADEKIGSILRLCVLVSLAVFVVGVAVAWYGTHLVVTPLAELSRTAEVMAEGDLTRDVAVRTQDETGALARAFARMAGSLKAVIGRIHSATTAVDETVGGARGAAQAIVDGSRRQSESVTSSSAAILQMDTSIKDVARSAERMSSSVVGTTTSLEELGSSIRQIDESVSALQAVTADASSSVLELGANVNEAASSIDDLGEQVERTATSIQEMAGSIQAVDGLATTMRGAAETTASTIGSMAESIREVGANAKAASELAQATVRDVGEGRVAVASTSEGMQGIRRSFDDTRAVIMGLGEGSRRIGEIVDIIDDVADRTNLLSLNAAIIAAEAGEQGRAFAVVAEEIRELAVKTAASTRDIAAIIRKVQGDVSTAVARMEQNDQIVKQGVDIARKADEALDKIQASGGKSLEMARLIEGATERQLAQSVGMTTDMDRLKGHALEISRATEEQARGSRAISEAVSEMRDRAMLVKKAASEQRIGGDRIAHGMEKVTLMIQQIARATREQAANAKLIMDAASEMESLALEVGRATSEQARSSAQVVSSVEVIRDATEQNTRQAAEMGERLRALGGQMAELRRHVEGLRV